MTGRILYLQLLAVKHICLAAIPLIDTALDAMDREAADAEAAATIHRGVLGKVVVVAVDREVDRGGSAAVTAADGVLVAGDKEPGGAPISRAVSQLVAARGRGEPGLSAANRNVLYLMYT